MEKIININFQGRVIPIEENAYNSLKQYIDSLRNHFANEESSDEIINDIENRIAELFSDRLKRGSNCIVGSDITAVIDSIGRLEDIEVAEGEEPKAPPHGGGYKQPEGAPQDFRGRFYRNADDKVIAGVCSGIAMRMGIDPIIVRILFVLLFGASFTIYVLLWIIVPSKSFYTNVTRRLYRNPDDKVIAGVCGGLAVYFRMETWILRLIFVLPLLAGILSRGMYGFWWHSPWGMGPRIFVGSFGSTLTILYVILWIALPYASSASDRLEMRGEKIDLNSIKAATQANAGAYPRPSRSGLGRVIGILFKAFFLFMAGVMAVSLFGVLIGIVFAGAVAAPFTDFLFDGVGQYTLAWAGTILFLAIPFLALITWIVRRLMGVRSHRHYLGYVFAGLWLISVICVLTLSGILIRNFGSRSMVEDTYAVQQPSVGKLYISVAGDKGLIINGHHHYHGRWSDVNWDGSDMPFYMIGNDSLWLNTVKVSIEQSDDSLFHVYETRISRGHSSEEAKNLASHISFPIGQRDSVITLPGGFTISNKDKFRNQQVLVTVEVPLGKHVQFNKDINRYNWFNINIEDGHRNVYFDKHWNDDDDDYRANSEYIMTPSGLINPLDSNDKDDDE